MSERKLLFSLGPKDFRVDTFRTGGPGGQHQNKTNSGVRITHLASGAVGEARDERSQLQNKKLALKRLVASSRFQAWHKLRCAQLNGLDARVEEDVQRALQPHNLRVDVQQNGRWEVSK